MIRLEVHLDGEWVSVDGVTSVELHQPEPNPAPSDRQARIDAAMKRISRNMSRAIREALRIPVEPTRRHQEQPEPDPWERLRDQPPMPPDHYERIVGALGQSEPPAPLTLPKRPDRPAWQSPYGPPHRHRH
ncbi:hypothetical protein [Streptomyces microflavus]